MRLERNLLPEYNEGHMQQYSGIKFQDSDSWEEYYQGYEDMSAHKSKRTKFRMGSEDMTGFQPKKRKKVSRAIPLRKQWDQFEGSQADDEPRRNRRDEERESYGYFP